MSHVFVGLLLMCVDLLPSMLLVVRNLSSAVTCPRALTPVPSVPSSFLPQIMFQCLHL